MIKSKTDYKNYILEDKKALHVPSNRKSPRPFLDSIWRYEIRLRKCEYYKNVSGFMHKFLYAWHYFRLLKLGERLGILIDPNVFGPGLCIAHYSGIIVNSNARVGANCNIQSGVCIGATGGSKEAPVIGDNCHIGSGAKIIGSIRIANNVTIGAGAVVIKDVTEENVTVVGVPARIIKK